MKAVVQYTHNVAHSDMKLRIPLRNCMAKPRSIFHSVWAIDFGKMYDYFLSKSPKIGSTS